MQLLTLPPVLVLVLVPRLRPRLSNLACAAQRGGRRTAEKVKTARRASSRAIPGTISRLAGKPFRPTHNGADTSDACRGGHEEERRKKGEVMHQEKACTAGKRKRKQETSV